MFVFSLLIFYRPPADNPLQEKKFIVYESCLKEVFRVCKKCQGPCDVTIHNPKNFGSNIKVVFKCELCLDKDSWHSQPKVGNIYAGNIAITAAILFSGASPTQTLRCFEHMNLTAVSNSTYYEHQKTYLLPAIVHSWRANQRHEIAQLKASDSPIILGGDVRADSPGHSAKYGSYTCMDINSGKIVDLQLVQVSCSWNAFSN